LNYLYLFLELNFTCSLLEFFYKKKIVGLSDLESEGRNNNFISFPQGPVQLKMSAPPVVLRRILELGPHILVKRDNASAILTVGKNSKSLDSFSSSSLSPSLTDCMQVIVLAVIVAGLLLFALKILFDVTLRLPVPAKAY
jgi:hypothetical protein